MPTQRKYQSLYPLDGRDIQTCIDELSEGSYKEITQRKEHLMSVRNMGESSAAECIGAVIRYAHRKGRGIQTLIEYVDRHSGEKIR